jgi:methyl-accepting chemotaxis protein
MAVSEAAARSEEIFHGADQQSMSTERMVSSMSEISKVAGSNAVAIEDVSRTARTQLEAVAATVESSEALTTLADELRGVLGRFETGSESVSGRTAGRKAEAGLGPESPGLHAIGDEASS